SGKSLGTYFRDEIATPLGLDFHIGLAEAEHARCGEMSMIPPGDPDSDDPNLGAVILGDPQSLQALAFLNPPSMALGPNNAPWRSAEIPGANGHGTARSLARVYGALACGGDVDGMHVLDAAGIARCHTELSRGPDLVLQLETRFGHGFMMSLDR